MQIVIDIPEDVYTRLFDNGRPTDIADGIVMERALRLGKTLSNCKDCKYFEYDSVANVAGVPLIVAHEICKKWGDGCKTKEDGFCFLFEPRESEDKCCDRNVCIQNEYNGIGCDGCIYRPTESEE